MTRILENRDPAEVSDIQIAAHASDFVLAGSETTSTALSCITYHLLQTPEVMEKLQAEIRGTFNHYDQINARSTLPLKYVEAVVLEGLRMYPPLPFALPRIVPEGGDTVDGHFLPAKVALAQVYPSATLTKLLDNSLNKPNGSQPFFGQFRRSSSIQTREVARSENK